MTLDVCLIDTYDSTAVSAISAELSVHQPSHINLKSSYLLDTSVLLLKLHNKGLPRNKISKINNNNHSQGEEGCPIPPLFIVSRLG